MENYCLTEAKDSWGLNLVPKVTWDKNRVSVSWKMSSKLSFPHGLWCSPFLWDAVVVWGVVLWLFPMKHFCFENKVVLSLYNKSTLYTKSGCPIISYSTLKHFQATFPPLLPFLMLLISRNSWSKSIQILICQIPLMSVVISLFSSKRPSIRTTKERKTTKAPTFSYTRPVSRSKKVFQRLSMLNYILF